MPLLPSLELLLLVAILALLVIVMLRQRSDNLRDELSQGRRESLEAARDTRQELAQRLDAIRVQLATDALNARRETAQSLADIRTQLDAIRNQIGADAKQARQESSASLGDLRLTVERHLSLIQADNNQKLERMRQTVEEKLEGTLERRLGDSFKHVSERLEQVHRGLGEMQTLAIGVGDLKKVMTNVKTRGIWGEIQLGSLLEQILAPEQFSANVQTKKNSPGRVEYAIKMPGRDGQDAGFIWMPIDAKFPLDSYHRLTEAQDKGDLAACEQAARLLEAFIKSSAKEIADKYISPPDTTDFAVMYLPTEGLFAEIARRGAVVDYIQREHRVIIAGPTTLAALLNSLQMGFRTLAVQKRSSEVWSLLGAVKAEFGKFEGVLDKVQKKLHQAGEEISSVQTRSRVITRKLIKVEDLPSTNANSLLDLQGASREIGEAYD